MQMLPMHLLWQRGREPMSYKGVLMLQAVYTMFGIHMHFSVIHVHIHRTT